MQVQVPIEVEVIFVDEEVEVRLIFLQGGRHLLKVFCVVRAEKHHFKVTLLKLGQHFFQIGTII